MVRLTSMPIFVKIGQKMCLWQQHEISQKQGVCVKTGVRATEVVTYIGTDLRIENTFLSIFVVFTKV